MTTFWRLHIWEQVQTNLGKGGRISSSIVCHESAKQSSNFRIIIQNFGTIYKKTWLISIILLFIQQKMLHLTLLLFI